MTKETKGKMTFFKSYYDVFKTIESKKNKLLFIEAVFELGFWEKNQPELDENSSEENNNTEYFDKKAEEIKEKIKKNEIVFASFLGILPNLKNSYKKYRNGLKGKDSGNKGGAKIGNQNARKTTPKQPQIEIEREVEKEKEKEEIEIEIEAEKELNEFAKKNNIDNYLYGEFKNVFLTEEQYNTLFIEVNSIYGEKIKNDKEIEIIVGNCIQELSKNINKGKVLAYDEAYLNDFTEHYETIQRYIRKKYNDKYNNEEEEIL